MKSIELPAVGGGQCHPGNEIQQVSFTIPPVKPGLIDRNFERAIFSLQKTNEAHYLSYKS
jgi:hypothetical protein